jgi:hypothetical protein
MHFVVLYLYKKRRKPVSRGLDAPTMKMYYKMLNNLINISWCTSEHSMFVHSLKKKDIFMMCVKTQKDVSWKAILERRKFSILHESYYLRTFVCEYKMSGYTYKYFLYKINNIEYIVRQCVHIQAYYIHTQRSLQTVYKKYTLKYIPGNLWPKWIPYLYFFIFLTGHFLSHNQEFT